MSATQASCLLYFDDEEAPALRLSKAAGLTALAIARHRFPDGELKLRLPVDDTGRLPPRAMLLRSLHQPNEKLVELLLAARTGRGLGVQHLTLVAPYLAYMRQDIAFHPGEAVSQQVVGGFLAGLFDAVITVDPHLHRIDRLEQAIPVPQAVVLSGAEPMADLIAQRRPNALLVGPDGESAQWIAQAAARHGFDHAVCTKVRHGDRQVAIELPALNAQGPGRGTAGRHGQHRPHAGAGRTAAAASGRYLGGCGGDACADCGRCAAGVA